MPDCCRAMPGEKAPSFGKPVPSTTHACRRTAATARHAGRVRTSPTGRVEDVMNCCNCW